MNIGKLAAALLAGLLFGAGLTVSGMINPAKIISFLDVSGAWDPSLLLVMGAALAVSFIGYRITLARARPILEEKFQLPSATKIDRPLIIGAALFGVGWGLGGLCPGPAISAAALGKGEIYIFLVALVAGMLLKDGFVKKAPAA